MDLTQLRVKLGERYDIDRELGRGGMGAVYLAAPVVAPDRIAALEQRVSELEHWRKNI